MRWENGTWVEVRTPFFFVSRLYDLPPFHPGGRMLP